jgi:hypothetical protein
MDTRYRIVSCQLDEEEFHADVEELNLDTSMWEVICSRHGSTRASAIARCDEWLSNERASEAAKQADLDRHIATREVTER